MEKSVRIGVIGAGKLGSTILNSIPESISTVWSNRSSNELKTYRLNGVSFRSRDDLVTGNNELEPFDGLWLAVPDRAIADVSLRLASNRSIDWSECWVLHSSGVSDRSVLNPLARVGAKTFVAHPNTILVEGEKFESDLVWGLEGDAEARKWFARLLSRYAPTFIDLDNVNSVLYHASATVAANYSMVLFDTARQLLLRAGVEEELANQLVSTYWKRVMMLIENHELHEVLSGPVQRGDSESVKRHVEEIDRMDSSLADRLRHLIAAAELAVRDPGYSKHRNAGGTDHSLL